MSSSGGFNAQNHDLYLFLAFFSSLLLHPLRRSYLWAAQYFEALAHGALPPVQSRLALTKTKIIDMTGIHYMAFFFFLLFFLPPFSSSIPINILPTPFYYKGPSSFVLARPAYGGGVQHNRLHEFVQLPCLLFSAVF